MTTDASPIVYKCAVTAPIYPIRLLHHPTQPKQLYLIANRSFASMVNARAQVFAVSALDDAVSVFRRSAEAATCKLLTCRPALLKWPRALWPRATQRQTASSSTPAYQCAPSRATVETFTASRRRLLIRPVCSTPLFTGCNQLIVLVAEPHRKLSQLVYCGINDKQEPLLTVLQWQHDAVDKAVAFLFDNLAPLIRQAPTAEHRDQLRYSVYFIGR